MSVIIVERFSLYQLIQQKPHICALFIRVFLIFPAICHLLFDCFSHFGRSKTCLFAKTLIEIIKNGGKKINFK